MILPRLIARVVPWDKESAVAAMLGATRRPPTEAELDRRAKLIEQARGKGHRR